MPRGYLVKRGVHAHGIGDVRMQRKAPCLSNPVESGLRARHARYRPALRHKRVYDRTPQIARSKHNRTSLLTLHLAHRIARFLYIDW
jgi:hypothetical protein